MSYVALPTKPAAASQEPCTPWHVHIGTVQLFIVGPGADAWFACSKPQYDKTEKVGTPLERNIAKRAAEALAKAAPKDHDDWPREIRRVWEIECRRAGVKPADILL